MRAALSRRAAAIAAVLLFVGGGAAAAGLAGLPGPGWAAPVLADASPSPSAGTSPSAGGSPSVAPSVQPTASPGPIIGSPTSPMSAHLSGDVYGYLPYWEMDFEHRGLHRLERPLGDLALLRHPGQHGCSR